MTGDESGGCSKCDGVTLSGYGPLVPVWDSREAFEQGHTPDRLGCAECRDTWEYKGTLTP